MHELKFGPLGFDHARSVLRDYLPGLDVGLLPLSKHDALLPATTLRSLELDYGKEGARAILNKAGVTHRQPVADTEALRAVLGRRTADLPQREARIDVDRMWFLDEVNVRPAWDHWGGPEAIDWGSVKVGQIDTGYTRHPAFGFPSTPTIVIDEGRTFFAPGAGGGDDAGPGGGEDPLDPATMDGHGTRVGSVIGGYDPTAPGGTFIGVAPRVPLVPVRIANHVLISHAQRELTQALQYLVREAKVSVINLSMGFLPRGQIRRLDRAIDEAYEAGVIFVCAAGQPLPSVVSPAHARRTIAVAGSTVGSVPWGSSARGSAVDWAAPSDQIERAQARRGSSPGYAGGGDGTSYGAAITSAAAALWLARHGDALGAAYTHAWQRVEAFEFVVKQTARPMPNQQPGSFGTGILNIGGLVQAALPAASVLTQERAV